MMEPYNELSSKLSKQCESLRSEAHEFSAEVIRPAAMTIDRIADPRNAAAPGSQLLQVLQAAYGLGYHRAAFPERLGGLGLPPIGVHTLLEELGWGSAGIALSLVASAIPALAAAADARPLMIERFVKPFMECSDASSIGCWAISEPRHGSDYFMVGSDEFRYPTSGAQVTARAEGMVYIIDGQKASWITNGGIATHALCSVAIEPSRSARGFLMIPLDLPGISRGDPTRKMGQREMNQAALIFDQVRVPREFMLKDEGYELEVARLLSLAHSSMGAIATGAARAAYEEALEHSKRRRQGGSRIADHQLVQASLFEMYTEVEACRALSRAALAQALTASKSQLEAAIAAKSYCTRTAFGVANKAMQLFGADGFCIGNLVEKLFRDLRICEVEQGVNEVLSLAGVQRILQ